MITVFIFVAFFVGLASTLSWITIRCLLSTPVQPEFRRSDSMLLSSQHKTLLPLYGSISTSLWAGLAEGGGTPVQWAGRLMWSEGGTSSCHPPT